MSAITSATAPQAIRPATYVNPVASSSTHANLSGTASQLGLESSIVATLGGSSTATPLYNAVGLLNSFISAGQASEPATGSTSASGSNPSNVNASWATILKAQPAEAATVAADSTIQGVLSTISTTA